MSSMKKVLLIGFILVLLIAIPVTVFLVQQQQKTQSGAVAATTISILPASQAPINVGDSVTLKVEVDPATATTTNQVSLVSFTINYDNTKLATDGAGFVVSGTPNLLTAVKGPTYTDGSVTVSLSANNNPQAVIKTTTDIATITFKALENTDTAPTQITFGSNTQVLSLGTSDQFNENVLASANPAVLTIAGGSVSPTPTPTATPTPTPSSNAPVCSSLSANATSGATPLNTNLTVNGTSNNSTISKVTFNFGDGQSQDITASGGIGTNSISVLQSHTYTTSGTFNATATLTDANNVVSNACSLTLTSGNTTTTATGTSTTTVVTAPTATPTAAEQLAAQPSPLPPTGPADLVKVGSVGAIITIIGAILLFAL